MTQPRADNVVQFPPPTDPSGLRLLDEACRDYASEADKIRFTFVLLDIIERVVPKQDWEQFIRLAQATFEPKDQGR